MKSLLLLFKREWVELKLSHVVSASYGPMLLRKIRVFCMLICPTTT